MKNKIITLILLLLIPCSVFAKTNYKADTELIIDENYNSSTFFAGQELTTNEDTKINGIAFIASQKSTIEGTSDYLAAASADIKIRGEVINDSFIATDKLSLYGKLNRDLYAIANNAYLSNEIKGNIRLFASKVKLENVVIGKNVTIYADIIEFGKNVEIKGKLKYNKNATVKNIENATVNSVTTYESDNYSQSFISILLSTIASTLNYILIGIIMLYIFPKLFNKKFEGKYMGFGALTLLLAPIVFLVLLMIPFTISLGFISILLFILLIYISIIIPSYMIGDYINKELLKNKESKYISLIIGIIVINLITCIPFIGGFIFFMAMLYGIGYIIQNLKNLR